MTQLLRLLLLPSASIMFLECNLVVLACNVTDMRNLPQAPEGVKKVVCASNPTSKICLKNSYMKKETGGSAR